MSRNNPKRIYSDGGEKSRDTLDLSGRYAKLKLSTKWRGCKSLVTIDVEKCDSFSHALKRFKVQCQQSGLTSEIKRHKEYEKPTERKRKKRLKAIRRQRRKMLKIQRLKSY